MAAAALVAVAAVGLGLSRPGIVRSWLGADGRADAIVLSGNIEAHESIVSFQVVQSRIVELPFDEGQWVKAGTVIARVDDSDYRQQVAIAQAAIEVQRRQLQAAERNLEAAEKTLASDRADLELKRLNADRDESLSRQGFLSPSALDQSHTALRQSSAQLERDIALHEAAARAVAVARATIAGAEQSLRLTQIVLDHTVLRAPFDGVVLVRQAELGEVATPGMPIITLADLDHVWLRAYINEPDIGKLRYGQAAVVSTDSFPGKRYEGRISFISSQAEFTPKTVETHAERITLVYRIRIDVGNPAHELVPGMPADARIDWKEPGS